MLFSWAIMVSFSLILMSSSSIWPLSSLWSELLGFLHKGNTYALLIYFSLSISDSWIPILFWLLVKLFYSSWHLSSKDSFSTLMSLISSNREFLCRVSWSIFLHSYWYLAWTSYVSASAMEAFASSFLRWLFSYSNLFSLI